MNKKLVYGILMLFLLSLPLLLSSFNTNLPNDQEIAINSPAYLSDSAVTVTEPSDISLNYGNSMIQTITWTLNDDSFIDYRGLYSFTNDSVGATPVGWTTTVPTGNSVEVVAGMAGHNKVVFINATTNEYPTLTPVNLSNTFTPQTSGTISFWMFPNSTGSQGCLAYVSGTNGFVFMLDFHPAGYWAWCNMGSWSNIGAGAKLGCWYHIVMTFADSSRTVQLYINGTHFTKSYCYPGLTWTPSSLQFKEYGPNQYLYVDAVDYSWAPGYYPNRNQDSANKTYAIFDDGIQKTTWESWSEQAIVPYDVSGTSLEIGSHNISLVFNDVSANWYHDDVQVTVQAGDSEAPKILEIVQNPVTPIYPQAVNVTAHITDNNTVQTVLIESNSTGDNGNYLGAYSFTDDAVGATPAGWTTSYLAGNNVQVVDGMEGHNKVAFINATTNEYPSGTPTILENAFTPQTSGTLSFWMFPNSTGSQGCIAYVSGTNGYVFMVAFHPAGYWAWCYMGTWSNIGAGAKLGCWYHFVMTFDDTAQTVQLYINGTHFTRTYCYPELTWTPSSLQFKVWGPNQYLYVDAIDYSWAPGYYPNRNTVGAAFTNYSMSLTSGNQQDGEWTYTFNNYPINKFISYRIFAQDTFGNWNVSNSYCFGYFDTVYPIILGVVQTPATLTQWEAVQVIAHVQDNTALANVALNSNYTGSWADYPMALLNGSLQDGFWGVTINNYAYNKSISYQVSALDIAEQTTTTGYSQFGYFPIVSTFVPLDLQYEVDVGMAGDRRTDITFSFQNTGNTNLVNINFTIVLPDGWTTKTLVKSVSQLAPGQTITITFKVTVPKDIGEFIEHVTITVDAKISELRLNWPTQSIEVVVSGVKVWDLFIWLVIIVGSASAAVSTTYVYVHRRSSGSQAVTTKVKGKNIIGITNALSTDIPGPLSAISMEIMEKIENLPDITDDEKRLIIQYISQLDEDEALRYLDELKYPNS